MKKYYTLILSGLFTIGLSRLLEARRSKKQTKENLNELKSTLQQAARSRNNHEVDIDTFIIIVNAALCTFLGTEETMKYIHRFDVKLKEDTEFYRIVDAERHKIGNEMNSKNNQMSIYDAVEITRSYLKAIGFNDTLDKFEKAASELSEENDEVKSQEFYYISSRIKTVISSVS